MNAGIVPQEFGIFVEAVTDLVQVNDIVARTEDQDDEALAQFGEYYKTPEIKQYIEETFKGTLVPAW